MMRPRKLGTVHVFVTILAFAGLTAAACSDEANTTTGAGGAGASAQGGAGATSQGGSTTNGGSSANGGNGTGGTSTGGSATGGAAMGGQGEGLIPAPCGNGQPFQCGDTIDNDGDGLIDSDDPDCLGACDDTEEGYHPELPGFSNGGCRQDCFWDGGNGVSETCFWDHQCDPLSVAPDYNPSGQDCENTDPPLNATYTIPGGGPTCVDAFNSQSQECLDECIPLTPNGCDCFGCCELPAGSGKSVYVGSLDADKNPTCFIELVDDPTKCQPCTQVPGCANDCATCEICIGKDFLPPECFDPPGGTGGGGGGGGTGQLCPGGQQQCGLIGNDPCPAGSFCITGCCQPLPS